MPPTTPHLLVLLSLLLARGAGAQPSASATPSFSLWASRSPTPTPSPSPTPVPLVVTGTIRLVVANLPSTNGCANYQLYTACSLAAGSAVSPLLPLPVYPNIASTLPGVLSRPYPAGAAFPGGAQGSTGYEFDAGLYQAPGGTPVGSMVAAALAPGSSGAKALVASIAQTSGIACSNCDVVNVSFSPSIYARTCFPPTCFPPGTTFVTPQPASPTPSPTPNAASATVTLGSTTVIVLGLPASACAAAEAACVQAVADMLTALLPPTAPAARSGAVVTRYYEVPSGTAFEASFAVMQPPGSSTSVAASLRGGLAAGSAGAGALAASVARATGTQASGLGVSVQAVQSTDYGGAGAGGGGGGGGGGGSSSGSSGASATTILLIALVVLQCTVLPASLLYCYARRGETVSLPPAVASFFGLAAHRTFSALDERGGPKDPAAPSAPGPELPSAPESDVGLGFENAPAGLGEASGAPPSAAAGGDGHGQAAAV